MTTHDSQLSTSPKHMDFDNVRILVDILTHLPKDFPSMMIQMIAFILATVMIGGVSVAGSFLGWFS